jgi:Molecular chaperone GrpE (heat shock protein)
MSKHKKHGDHVEISLEAEEKACAAKESSEGTAVADSEPGRPAVSEQDYADLKLKYDQVLRTAADLDNQRKRASRERDESLKYGQERLLSELLPIVDNLNRTLKSVPEQSQDPLLNLVGNGVKMILKQFADLLGKYSVQSFSSVGQPFDPNWHEALLRTETTDYPPGTIIDELSQGYKIHERLLRPAMVNVAYLPTTAADEGEIDETGSSG